ncbi:MAG: DUF429 domain-containing protein [Trueperaceae bacterium]|nr:DUF429 domain-containing protein [Trueperaceae bacterium]
MTDAAPPTGPSLPAPVPLAGVDGARGGWVAVHLPAGGDAADVRAALAPDVGALLDALPPDAQVAIDVPIGLPEAGPRACDVAARRVLGPRRASVFAAPVRAVLAAGTYEGALAGHRAADGRGLAKQAYHLLPKIREVDALLAASPALEGRVKETHPEVAFATLAGAPMAFPKRRPDGRRTREALLEAHLPGVLARVRGDLEGASGVAPDDVLDAVALLLAAARRAAGRGRVLPARGPTGPARDAAGRAMEIHG